MVIYRYSSGASTFTMLLHRVLRISTCMYTASHCWSRLERTLEVLSAYIGSGGRTPPANGSTDRGGTGLTSSAYHRHRHLWWRDSTRHLLHCSQVPAHYNHSVHGQSLGQKVSQ